MIRDAIIVDQMCEWRSSFATYSTKRIISEEENEWFLTYAVGPAEISDAARVADGLLIMISRGEPCTTWQICERIIVQRNMMGIFSIFENIFANDNSEGFWNHS